MAVFATVAARHRRRRVSISVRAGVLLLALLLKEAAETCCDREWSGRIADALGGLLSAFAGFHVLHCVFQ